MSIRKDVLFVVPPFFLTPEDNRERHELHGITCSRCHGMGWFWSEDETGESVKRDCPVCKGRKRLKASVTIEWHADDAD